MPSREARAKERSANHAKAAAAAEVIEKLLQPATNRSVEALTETIQKGEELLEHSTAMPKALRVARSVLAKLQAEHVGQLQTGLIDLITQSEATNPNLRKEAQQLRGYFGDLFAEGDEDSNAVLDFDEFSKIMEVIAPTFQGDELRAAFLAADLDGDGTIDRREFLLRAPQYAAIANAQSASPTKAAPSLESLASKAAAAPPRGGGGGGGSDDFLSRLEVAERRDDDQLATARGQADVLSVAYSDPVVEAAPAPAAGAAPPEAAAAPVRKSRRKSRHSSSSSSSSHSKRVAASRGSSAARRSAPTTARWAAAMLWSLQPAPCQCRR